MLQDEEAKTEVVGKADFYTKWPLIFKMGRTEKSDLSMTQWLFTYDKPFSLVTKRC